MKDTLKDLNDHLFAEMERLGDEELKGEDLDNEIRRADAVSKIREAVTPHAHWYYDPDKPVRYYDPDKPVGCGATIGGMFCSNCGGDCPTGSHPCREFKYCPWCGARMDDEVAE